MSDDRFYKLHGTGNDFIVVRDTHPLAKAEWASLLCDRHRGVGADGVLILSEHNKADARLVIINADGSRPEMCGNGVRCVARHMVESEDFKSPVTLMTDAGLRSLEIVESGEGPWQVAVNMGRDAVNEAPIEIDNGVHDYWARAVDMGNPHAVAFVDAMPSLDDIDALGEWVNDDHDAFPEGVNLEFVVQDGDRLEVVVFERGVGRTLACGTGACAVAAAAWYEERTDSLAVTVGLPGGDLLIERRLDEIWMTGGAEAVFDGRIGANWIEQRK